MKLRSIALSVLFSSLLVFLVFSGCERDSVGPRIHNGFPFDRDVLYVDDYFDVVPGDAAHDDFINNILTRCREYTDSIYVYNTYRSGPGGEPREYAVVDEPSLSELSRYKLVIWDTKGSANQFDTGIRRVVQLGILEAYLRGGGRLWLFGEELVRATADIPEAFAYPSEPDFDSFARKYLKISGQVNRWVRTSLDISDGFMGANPNRALSDMLPFLELDPTKPWWSPTYGLSKVEAVMSAMQDDDTAQRPDTLYFYQSKYGSSDYMNKACAFRFYDTYSASKVVYSGFPMHFFKDEQAESLGTFVIDWMFEDM